MSDNNSDSGKKNPGRSGFSPGNIDTSEEDASCSQVPTVVGSPAPTGPQFSSSSSPSSPERGRPVGAVDGAQSTPQHTLQREAEPFRQTPGQYDAGYGPPPPAPPLRPWRPDPQFEAYRGPGDESLLPETGTFSGTFSVQQTLPSTYTYDFKTEKRAIPGTQPAPAALHEMENSIPSSTRAIKQTVDWLQEEIQDAEKAIMRTEELLQREGEILDQLYIDYDWIREVQGIATIDQYNLFQESIMRTGGEILRQNQILSHQNEILRLLHVYYDYEYMTCPCSRAIQPCADCAAKEDQIRMYTMNAPACYAISPTIQVPLNSYETLSPSVYGRGADSSTTILVPVTLVRYIPVTEVITLPPTLVVAVRQPIVAETRVYTSQTVDC